MKRTIILLMVVALIFGNLNILPSKVEAASNEIKDISGHWAEYPIWILTSREILSGYPDNTFRPNNPITRSEYMTALFKTACVLDESLTLEETPSVILDFYYLEYGENERKDFLKNFKNEDLVTNYKDLKNHWSKNAVSWVKNYSDTKNPGLFEKVFPGDNFYPNQPITREEAAVVTTAFLAPAAGSRNIQFKDIPSNYKFKEEIKFLVDNNIINGFSDGTFRPKENINRASAAVIMESLLIEIAYNMDFLSISDNYTEVYISTGDSDYIATFLTEELYANPPTEEDKKYVAHIKANEIDRGYLQELSDISMFFDPDSLGLDIYKLGVEEYNRLIYEEISRLEDELIEKYEKIKKETIPYYGEDLLKTLKELESKDYWNKAGLYSALYNYDQNQSIEYLEKAEKFYDINKNGKDDLLILYYQLIYHYLYIDKDNQKVVEYVHKLDDLYDPSTDEGSVVAYLDIDRFYLFSASDLAQIGEYGKALDYVNRYEKSLNKSGQSLCDYITLEKGALMYINGEKAQAIKYLQNHLVKMRAKDYVDENLLNKYIWAIKTMMR